jgi:hypothetical protein
MLYLLSKRFKLLSAAAALLPAVAHAATISNTNAGTANDVNILFNSNLLLNDAYTVQGVTNTNPGFLVDFTSSAELHANGGQATITALDGGFFSDVSTYMDSPAADFQSLIFDVHATAAGTVSVQVFDINGLLPLIPAGPFAVTGNGSNFFTVRAGANESITKITLTYSGPGGLLDFQQIRMSQAPFTPNPPPELAPTPATSLAGLTLLAGLALSRKRKS